MTSIRIPSEEEIRQASQQGEEAVIALWQETIPTLEERIQKLEDQMAAINSAGGKPPSSDGHNQKQLIIILGAIGIIILLAWFAIRPFIKNIGSSNNDQVITEITLCDVDDRDLCVVSFGTDKTDRMVVNFQLPNADYPAFYIHGANKNMDNRYPCEVAEAAPTSVYCTGERTPLGEAIDIEVFAADSDLLIARGVITVSAMVISTPINLTPTPGSETGTPTSTVLPSPTPTIRISPTSTPDPAYPNP